MKVEAVCVCGICCDIVVGLILEVGSASYTTLLFYFHARNLYIDIIIL